MLKVSKIFGTMMLSLVLAISECLLPHYAKEYGNCKFFAIVNKRLRDLQVLRFLPGNRAISLMVF